MKIKKVLIFSKPWVLCVFFLCVTSVQAFAFKKDFSIDSFQKKTPNEKSIYVLNGKKVDVSMVRISKTRFKGIYMLSYHEARKFLRFNDSDTGQNFFFVISQNSKSGEKLQGKLERDGFINDTSLVNRFNQANTRFFK